MSEAGRISCARAASGRRFLGRAGSEIGDLQGGNVVRRLSARGGQRIAHLTDALEVEVVVFVEPELLAQLPAEKDQLERLRPFS